MRKPLLLSTFLAGCFLAATPALADDAAAPASDFTITGSAGVWSQYRFRGISQSDNKPVFQGSLTVTHKSGVYLSVWGSSASSNDAVNIGGTEIDVFAGYSKTIAGWTLDGGLYGYIYPGSGRATGISENYYEVYGDVSRPFGPLTTKVGINWAPHQAYFDNWDTATKHSIYVYGELGLAVPNFPITFHGHIGHTGGGFDYSGHQYIDYTVGASYKWKMLTFDISLVGTNLSKQDTFYNTGSHDYYRAAKTAALGSISASF